MPTYEYKCLNCGKTFSLQMSITEHDIQKKVACPHCKSENVSRIYSTFSAVTSKKS